MDNGEEFYANNNNMTEQTQIPEQQIPNTLISPDSMSISAFAQQSADLVKWELDLQDLTEEIEHHLRGEVYDIRTNAWQVRGKQLCNTEGIRTFVTMLRSRFHKGIILSNYTQAQVLQVMKRIDAETIRIIFMNWIKFEIDCAYWDTVRNIVIQNIHAAYLRAVGGGERRFLSTTQKRFEQVNIGQPRGSGGFSSFLQNIGAKKPENNNGYGGY